VVLRETYGFPYDPFPHGKPLQMYFGNWLFIQTVVFSNIHIHVFLLCTSNVYLDHHHYTKYYVRLTRAYVD